MKKFGNLIVNIFCLNSLSLLRKLTELNAYLHAFLKRFNLFVYAFMMHVLSKSMSNKVLERILSSKKTFSVSFVDRFHFNKMPFVFTRLPCFLHHYSNNVYSFQQYTPMFAIHGFRNWKFREQRSVEVFADRMNDSKWWFTWSLLEVFSIK